jgi:hypothetical protein
MSQDDTESRLQQLLQQMEAIEQACAASNLFIYRPTEEEEPFFKQLCQRYLGASAPERERIRSAVREKRGVLNCLLGYVYKAADRIHTAADQEWLRIGLAAASIEDCRVDYRDFLLALAALYTAAKEAGVNPRADFNGVAALSSREKPRGGTKPVSEMLARFHSYSVARTRFKRRRSDG